MFLTSLILLLLVATFFYLIPLSSHFFRYLWWQLTTDIPVRSGVVISDNTAIHYQAYGQGQPVLLLHGGLSNKLSWFSQLPALADCGYQLILVDSRGHGLSALGQGELSYRLLASDALAVLDQLQIDRTDIVGWSDGANTALLMAELWPQRVARIVSISGNYDPSGLTPLAQRENLELSTGLKYWLYRLWTGAGAKLSELEKRLKKLWRNGPRFSASDLQRITAPVLIIVGDHDIITLEHTELMAKLLPDSTLKIIHNGGHATLMTHPEQVNSLLREFLKTPKTLCR